MKIYVLMVLIGAIVASTKLYRQNLLQGGMTANLRMIQARCLRFRHCRQTAAISVPGKIERSTIAQHRFSRLRGLT